MNPDLILHHFDSSPFSEKLRLILGFKQLPWLGVKVPPIMPKPDVVALTGGYRRTPFLQIGADIYCDSALVARVLDALAPLPTLYPASAPLAPLLAQWLDSTLFWTVVPFIMQPAGLPYVMGDMSPEKLKAFAVDRAPFSASMPRLKPADAAVQLSAALQALDAQLADGRRWLLGNEASIADFSLAHNLWFLRRAGPLAAVLDEQKHLSGFERHMQAIGHGEHQTIDSAEALNTAAAAANAGSHAAVSVAPGLGFEADEAISVAAIDYGTDAVSGALVGLSTDRVTLRRHDERAGTLHVHFPRHGFRISKVSKDKV